MKKTLTFTFAILLTGLLAQAQTESPNTTQKTYLSKQLNITDSLSTEVESIMATYKADAGKVAESKKLSPQEMRAKIDVLIDEKNAKLKKILTDEQLDKLLPTTEKVKR